MSVKMCRFASMLGVAACASLSLSAGSVRHVPLDGAAKAAGWKGANGDIPVLSDEEGGVRFSYTQASHGWGNMEHAFHLPADAVAIAWEEQTLTAQNAAKRYLWLREPDGDLWMTELWDSKSHLEKGWRSVTVPLSRLNYQPRGNKKRELEKTVALLMGFNYADQSAKIRNLKIVARSTTVCGASRPATVYTGSERVAVLCCTDEKPHALDVLNRAGIPARAVSSVELADEKGFAKTNTDLLVIPCSPFFPRAAIANFKRFLREGGAFFAFGGYAFDQIAENPSNGQESADGIFAGLPTAVDISANNLGSQSLNSRFGKAGDTVGYPRDVVAVFDPSFLVRRSAKIVVSQGQFLLPRGSVFKPETAQEPYPAAVAMTGSNSPVFPNVHARFIPILEARDRLGRSRGPVLSMVLNYAGAYKGSAWAFSGHPTLFKSADPAADTLLANVCRRLLAPGCVTTFSCDPVSFDVDERVTLTARTQAVPNGTICRFRVEGRTVAEVVVSNDVARVEFVAKADDSDDKGLVRLVVEASRDGRAFDMKETGGLLRRTPKGPAFAFKDNAASIDGRRRFFGGMNTTGMMWYSQNEDPLVWARDFGDMADYGMKFLRILHFSPFAKADHPEQVDKSPFSLTLPPPEKTCRQTDAIVQLANYSNVSVMLALHDWIPWELEEDELAAEAKWDAYWVDRYKAWPGLFYDIQNEPHAGRIKPFGPGRRWTDLAARDGERRRSDYFHRWQKVNADAVHAVHPKAAVTTGHLQTLDAAEKQLSTDGIDFSNVHHYGDAGHLRSVVKLTDRRFEGRGISLGEFGSRIAHDARARGETDDPAELSIRHFLHVNHYLYGMGGAFSGVWDWKDFQDCVFPWGMTFADGTPKDVLPAYRNMTMMFGAAGPIVNESQTYLVLPDSFRLGGDSGRIHEALRKAVDALLCLGVPFNVINEEGLARLPETATTLIWPMAVCPTDGAFASVVQFVRNEGKLLVTGDLRFDADRRPTREARLGELGLKAPFSPLDPFLANPPSNAVPCRARNVVWCPVAPELANDESAIRALYRAFLDDVAKVPRLKSPASLEGGLIRFGAKLETGGTSEIAVNTLDRSVTFGDVALAPQSTYWRWRDGSITSACALAGAAPGIKVEGAPCGLLALDGRDLSVSHRILVLPYGACHVKLVRALSAPSLQGERGEFRSLKWHGLETVSPKSTGGALSFDIPADTPCDLVILHAEGENAAAISETTKLL